MTDESDAPPTYPTDADIAEVLAEFDGDHRRGIAALLHDLSIMAADYDASVSRGYVRAPAAPAVVRKLA